jgi:hypothetical protein
MVSTPCNELFILEQKVPRQQSIKSLLRVSVLTKYNICNFFQIRTTKRVSMWPVGLCTKFGLSSPVVVNGTFVGFYDGWVAGRKFPVDMAGFAVNVQFLLQVTQILTMHLLF